MPIPIPIPPLPASHIQPKSLHDTSLPREILKILSNTDEIQSASLPPIVPTSGDSVINAPPTAICDVDANSINNTPNAKKQLCVKINNKPIDTTKKVRPWIWAPFSSSARTDGLLLHHWVRAGVEYPDYPYARFDVHLEKLSYNENDDGQELGVGIDNNNSGREGGVIGAKKDDSNAHGNSSAACDTTASTAKKSDKVDIYKEYLRDENWTRSETDALLNLCQIHELRWPIIVDRWISKFGHLSGKKVEDLQHRYYTIGIILNRRKVGSMIHGVPCRVVSCRASFHSYSIWCLGTRTTAFTFLSHPCLIPTLFVSISLSIIYSIYSIYSNPPGVKSCST